MRDFKTLALQPKEYFKDFTREEYESKEPIKLRYWFTMDLIKNFNQKSNFNRSIDLLKIFT